MYTCCTIHAHWHISSSKGCLCAGVLSAAEGSCLAASPALAAARSSAAGSSAAGAKAGASHGPPQHPCRLRAAQIIHPTLGPHSSAPPPHLSCPRRYFCLYLEHLLLRSSLVLGHILHAIDIPSVSLASFASDLASCSKLTLFKFSWKVRHPGSCRQVCCRPHSRFHHPRRRRQPIRPAAQGWHCAGPCCREAGSRCDGG